MGALLGSFVELHLHVQLLALLPQLNNALLGSGGHLVHDQQGGIALDVVGGLVGIACHQRALAALFFDGPHALFSLFALLGFQGRTLGVDSEGPIWRRVIPEGLNSRCSRSRHSWMGRSAVMRRPCFCQRRCRYPALRRAPVQRQTQ